MGGFGLWLFRKWDSTRLLTARINCLIIDPNVWVYPTVPAKRAIFPFRI